MSDSAGDQPKRIYRKPGEKPLLRVQVILSEKAKRDLRKFAGRHGLGVAIEELLRRERERQRSKDAKGCVTLKTNTLPPKP